MRVWNRTLSAAQILALYESGSNTIASAETEIDEKWMACVTPFSASGAGQTECTDTITVQDESVPVFVRKVESRWVNERVEIAWELRGAPDGIEFAVYRSDDVTMSFVSLHGSRVVRRGDGYLFVDESAEPGRTYTYRVSVLESGEEIAAFETSPSAAALSFGLGQNHPNPFNPVTTITFSLDAENDVALRVYDISGKLVRTLVERRMKAGVHKESWDGRDENGDPVASGVYFYRLTEGDRTLTRKAVLLK